MARRKHSCGPLKMSMKWLADPRWVQLPFLLPLIWLEIRSYIGGTCFNDMIASLIRLEIGSSPFWGQTDQTNQVLFRQNMCVSLCHSGIEPDVFWLISLWVITTVLRSCLCFSQAVFNWKNQFFLSNSVVARLVKKLHPGDATGISAGSAMMQSTLSLGVYHVYIYIYIYIFFLIPLQDPC